MINNAGVNAPGALYEVTYEDWDWVLGVNLNGVVNGIQEFLPTLMSNRGDAHIINIASVGGLVGMRGLGIYNASKLYFNSLCLPSDDNISNTDVDKISNHIKKIHETVVNNKL